MQYSTGMYACVYVCRGEGHLGHIRYNQVRWHWHIHTYIHGGPRPGSYLWVDCKVGSPWEVHVCSTGLRPVRVLSGTGSVTRRGQQHSAGATGDSRCALTVDEDTVTCKGALGFNEVLGGSRAMQMSWLRVCGLGLPLTHRGTPIDLQRLCRGGAPRETGNRANRSSRCHQQHSNTACKCCRPALEPNVPRMSS